MNNRSGKTALSSSGVAVCMALTASLFAAPEPRIVLDGKVGDDEWKGASSAPTDSDATVLLIEDEEDLFVALRGFPESEFGFGCLFVAVADDVYVLHASAKLGTARYQRRDTVFEPVEKDYAWKEAAMLWREEGWQANVSDASGNQEFRISKSRLGQAEPGNSQKARRAQPLAIAIGYIWMGEEDQARISGWPQGLVDGTRNEQVLGGWNPDHVTFDTKNWHSLVGE